MIKIVKCSNKQVELIIDLAKKTFLESHGNSASKTDVKNFISKTYTKELLLKDISNRDIYYHFIYFKNKLAGYAKIVLNTPHLNIDKQKVAKLDRFYLLKEFYGKNIGEALFNFQVDFAKKNQQQGIWLVVWIDNIRAVKFYEKNGFQIVGKYDFHISKTHSNPNHVMYLKF